MINKLQMLLVLCIWLLLSWCQSSLTPIQNNIEETTAPSYTMQQIPVTISCDEYNIQSIKDLWYTGDIIPQGTGCVINGTQHKYDVISLGVRIIFDNTFSPYFLDQSKIPHIILQENKIMYDKNHSLIVIKNYTWALADYITHNFSQCEYAILDPVTSSEYQIKCEWSGYLYFYNVNMIDTTIYNMQYAIWDQWFRFEIL